MNCPEPLYVSSTPISWEELPLQPHHVDSLKASAISPEVASERGYRSITDTAELAALGYSQAQAKLLPGLLTPQFRVNGEQFQDVYRPDNPRADKNGKVRKYEYRYRQQMVLDVHPRGLGDVLNPEKLLFITEGVKKGDAAATAGLACIAVGGVWNWRSSKLPKTGKPGPLPDWVVVPLKGRTVVVAYDSDVMEKTEVFGALEALSAFLEAEGATVRYCYLPSGENGAKTGLDDYLAAGHGVDDLMALVTDELRRAPDPLQRQFSLRVDQDSPLAMKDTSLVALAAANEPATLFAVGGHLARVQADAMGSRVRLLTLPMLRDRLERVALWECDGKNGLKEVTPPKAIIEDLLAYPDHHQRFPVLTQVVTAPCFAADGTMVVKPGYSASAQVFYDPCGLEILPLPTPVEGVALVVDELLADFPFASDADLANAIALFLLPLARPMIDGTTPLHVIEAPVAGTGKGLLTDMLLYPVSAGQVARTTECANDDEWRKRITALLAAGRQTILIDNVNRPLDSGVLAAALTAPNWEDRILGLSQMVTVPNRAVWVATANNPVLSAELARRSVYIRLDAKVEKPWERQGFRHGDLRGWTADHRGVLVAAGLAIVKAWLDAGRPMAEVAFGDYRSWAQTMGGILQLAGISGFLANASDRFDATASELDELRGFVSMWWEQHKTEPVKAARLLELADIWQVGPALSDKTDRTTAFGMWMKKQVDRMVDGKRVTLAKQDRNGAKYYRLVPIDASEPTQGFRTKTPAQSVSAEPCGTLSTPEQFGEQVSNTAVNCTGEVSNQGPAGVRTPAPTSTSTAEPLAEASTGTPTRVRL